LTNRSKSVVFDLEGLRGPNPLRGEECDNAEQEVTASWQEQHGMMISFVFHRYFLSLCNVIALVPKHIHL
jgi:hypothetical protein